MVPASGLHFGTFDQAAHAGTMKLGRMDPSEFDALPCDSSGWKGRILKVALVVHQVERVQDCKTPEKWAAAIREAAGRGTDCLVYANEFEGREPADSYVVWSADNVTVICDDVTRASGSPVD